MVGSRSVNTGCSSPEVITCPRSHQGFKHRFCIKIESAVLGILLTGGCATSRHCQQQALPGTRIHCRHRDLCNGSPPRSSCPVRCSLIPGMVLATFLLWSRPQRRAWKRRDASLGLLLMSVDRQVSSSSSSSFILQDGFSGEYTVGFFH
ncbi:uncharacterized protein LOC107326134 isoform X3 [Python bivittatus]|nr:uncharacterized protein LOC107326134 isoform X3 [Python bivittatus]